MVAQNFKTEQFILNHLLMKRSKAYKLWAVLLVSASTSGLYTHTVYIV
jgi:hypothetical protein